MEDIHEQFPKCQFEIEQLCLESADFRELCEDYKEVNSMVATWSDSDDTNQVVIDEYQALLKDLETEIMEYVEGRTPAVELPDQQSNP